MPSALSGPGLRRALLALFLVTAALLSVSRLSRQGARLVSGTGPEAAGDLKSRRGCTVAAIAGQPVYRDSAARDGLEPPAAYLILWPFIGWPEWPAARILWAGASALGLAALAWLLVGESGETSVRGKALVVLLVTSGYGFAVSVGLGQLGPVVVPAALLAVVLARRSDGPPADVAAALCFLLALTKPTVTAAFFWPLLFLARRIRPALLAVGLYAAATAVVLAIEPSSVAETFRGVMALGSRMTPFGYGHLPLWLSSVGLARIGLPATALFLAALGAWVYRHRGADPWIVLGVTAIVARVAAYHRFYDDLLLVVPAFALLRLSRTAASPGIRRWAGALFAAAAVAQLAPTRLYEAGGWTAASVQSAQVALWTAELVFLLAAAEGAAVPVPVRFGADEGSGGLSTS